MNSLQTTQTVLNDDAKLDNNLASDILSKHVLSHVESETNQENAIAGINEYLSNTLIGVPLTVAVSNIQIDFNVVLFSNWEKREKIQKLLTNRLANFTGKGTKLSKPYHSQPDSRALGFKLETRGNTKEKGLKQAHFAHIARQAGLYTPEDVKKAYSPFIVTIKEPTADSQPSEKETKDPKEFNGMAHLIAAYKVVLDKHNNGSCTLIGSEYDRIVASLEVLQG
jgi:hypothetical protein